MAGNHDKPPLGAVPTGLDYSRWRLIMAASHSHYRKSLCICQWAFDSAVALSAAMIWASVNPVFLRAYRKNRAGQVAYAS